MAKVVLYGDNIFCNLILKSSERIEDLSSEIDKLKMTSFSGCEWDNSSVLSITFDNNSISGSNFSGDFSNIKYFDIYKQFSDQEKLHKVGSTLGSTNCIIEDYVVGNKCPYTYYIFPICEETVDEVTTETIGTVLQSEKIELNDNIIRVIGLKQDSMNLNKYFIDTTKIWNLYIDVENTGFRNNMARSYNDTLNKYQKEIIGNGSYRTFSIKGSLSKIDCVTNEYNSSYDDIVEWENFIDDPCLKLLIDIRGIVTIGSIDSNSCEYEQGFDYDIYANFTFRQLNDLDNMEIINPQLLVNPIYENLLADVSPNILFSTEDIDKRAVLVVPKE